MVAATAEAREGPREAAAASEDYTTPSRDPPAAMRKSQSEQKRFDAVLSKQRRLQTLMGTGAGRGERAQRGEWAQRGGRRDGRQATTDVAAGDAVAGVEGADGGGHVEAAEGQTEDEIMEQSEPRQQQLQLEEQRQAEVEVEAEEEQVAVTVEERSVPAHQQQQRVEVEEEQDVELEEYSVTAHRQPQHVEVQGEAEVGVHDRTVPAQHQQQHAKVESEVEEAEPSAAVARRYGIDNEAHISVNKGDKDALDAKLSELSPPQSPHDVPPEGEGAQPESPQGRAAQVDSWLTLE